MLGALVILTMPAMAQVSGVSGIARTTGQVAAIQPPPSLADGRLENDTRAFIFLERENYSLEQNLNLDIVNPGFYDSDSDLTTSVVPAGTIINSYYVHVDPSTRFAEVPLPRGINGGVTFEEDILGIIVKTSRLVSSTSELGTSRTQYVDQNGLEFTLINLGPEDEITFEGNRRVLRFEFRNYIEIDQMRVITSSEAPASTSPPSNGGGNSGGTSAVAPNARGESVSVTEGRSVRIDVLDNDTDGDNAIDRSTLRVTTAPQNGSTSINASSREITYRPNANFTGADSFVYQVCDTADLCDTATVRVTVNASNTSSGNGSGSSGSGDRTSGLTLQTLLPAADDCSAFDEARIDIVPGNRENKIRLDDEIGYTPVAILSSEDFPAPNCVDVSTILFGPEGDVNGFAISCGVINVNLDQWKDVLCDFKTTDLGFSADDSEGELSADTIESGQINETGDVTIIGVRRLKNFIAPRSASNPELNVKAMQFGQSILIIGQAAGAARTQVSIYSAQGQLIRRESAGGSLLRMNLSANGGSQLANGVYLLVVTLLDSHGDVIGRELKKLAVVR